MSTKDDPDEGERFVRLLAAHGLNKYRLAKKIGMSPSTIQKWESQLREGTASQEVMDSIAEALTKVNIDPAELRPEMRPRTGGRVLDLMGPILAITNTEILSVMRDLLLVDSSYDRDILLKLVQNQIEKH